MMFANAILKTEFFPPISTFWAINQSEHLYLEVCENYQKKSTRNRAQILGANGIEVISVPLKKGKNNKMSILDVEISNEDNWQSKHLHTIRSAYGNSPYFEYYFEPIQEIMSMEHKSLLMLNQRIFDFFVEALNLEIELKKTEEYHHSYTEKDCDLRNIDFNSPIIPSYEAKFYNQVFEEKHGFVSGISILDLLMCKGPESILYI